jgi:hypothetical protein
MQEIQTDQAYKIHVENNLHALTAKGKHLLYRVNLEVFMYFIVY